MREFQHKKRARRLIYSPLVIALLIVLLIVLARGVWSAWEKRAYAGEKAKEVAAQLDLLKEREAELSRRVARLQSEQGKEEELREKFLVGKEGEGVVFIVDAPPATSTNTTQPEKSLWARFLDWFR